ncbi:MAG: class I SAM-dependent methyltransferase [Pikeienuella sp.]
MYEKRLIAMLENGFRQGAVEITFPSGKTHRFGDNSEPIARLRLTDPAAVKAAWSDPALQFAELYMHERLVVEQGDMYDFMALAKQNGAKGFITVPAAAREIARRLHRRLRRHVFTETAKRNVAHHYDLDEKLFRLFLDEDLQYSCAYFENGDETLEQAQLKKKRHIAAKMQMATGQRVLDIGCGWGGMGLYLAQNTDAVVTGVTLSEEQHRVANNRADALGLSAKFHLQDYRTVTGPFDRIVSVGMFEHVGPQHYDEYFKTIRQVLADDGVALIHSIVRAKPNSSDPPFVEKYIFPNGHIPALSEVMPSIERAGLLVKDVEILTYHYADTLREWRKRFHANKDAVIGLYDEVFFRMWDLYLIASEISFRHGKLANFQIQLTRRQAEGPRNRSYIQATEAALQERENQNAASKTSSRR